MTPGPLSKHVRTIAAALAVFALGMLVAPPSRAQARKREPNSAYAERRRRLRAQVDGPVVLFGFTGQEDSNPAAVFNQEPYFYYMTGHNEPGAAILLVPGGEGDKRWEGPHEILYLPPRNPRLERWEGPRMAPADPQIAETTGCEAVRALSELENDLKKLVRNYPELFTLMPTPQDTGYPHAKNWSSWLYRMVPQIPLHDVAPRIGAMRQIKSPGELELIERAIELSVDAHLEAMRMMRPGLYEYEVAAKMIYIHAMGGSAREAYGAIVGAGIHSTILHYTGLTSRIEPGDIVVLDVGAEYSGYAADITRTLPTDGKYSARQREIYEIVLGAQNAAFAACKPGMTFASAGDNSLTRIAHDYINTHGTDKEGRTLGPYFIHGLGHHIGLDVHDAGDPNRVLESGMVITLEPGIYIPEESLGVRIEDDVLVTESGCKMLTARLPRTMEEIERIMAEAKKGHD